ncbi:MAG: HEAT repeat domain-containing protein [Candidatus Manganitrophus sp. SB1]|nr:HEAT repeat domain-containing protein [Candidatus Manganitrophus morganii]
MDDRTEAPMTDQEPVEEGEEYDKEEVKSAKEIVQYLTKTTKTLQIYLPNNPIHQKFINELAEKIQRHLTEHGPLRLRIKQFELFCSGQPVYENSNRMESLAFKLFIDGLRELSFHPGIEKEELIIFLEVIGNRGEGDNVDDDIVTLLWEKHLVHVKYIVVDELQGDYRAEECKEMQTVPAHPNQLREMFHQEAAPQALEAPKGVEIPSLHIFKLTDEEIRRMKAEVRGEEELDMVAELEGILFDILRIERDPGLFGEILGIIDNIFESLLLQGDFPHARAILEFFQEMIDPSMGLPQSLIDQIQKAKVQAGNPKRIGMLENILNECEPDRLEEFSSLMMFFDQQIVPSLVELLGAVDKMKARRVICEILIKLGGRQIDFLIAKLDDDRWYLVRNLIYVVGKIGDPKALKSFPRLLQHKDPKIRKEVLHALDMIESPKTNDLLAKVLSDPDLSNRLFAVRALAKRKAQEGLEPLMNLLPSKEFDEKELHEKKEIFDAIAKIGGDKVVPRLRRLLEVKWSLFKNARAEEMGLCAAFALQRIGSPPAVEALREGSGSKSKQISEACAKALELLGTGKT